MQLENKRVIKLVLLLGLGISITISTVAQDKNLVVRIANLQIDAAQLDAYKAAVKLHAETAVKTEAGVLNLYAVYEKNNPTHVTVFEIYANEAAYQAHLLTPHFLQYKTKTKNMVRSLELIETMPIALETKYTSTSFPIKK